jgi:micrococcal nuclease
VKYVRIAVALAATTLLLAPLSAHAQTELPAGDDARVIRVISGDTLQVDLAGKRVLVGLIGVDAPDPVAGKTKAECHAAQSTAALRKLLNRKTVRLVRDTTETDTAGRAMRYVFLSDGVLINEAQLQTGAAKVDTRAPDTRYQERFTQAEAAAKTAVTGLWKSCASAPVTAPAIGGCTRFEMRWVSRRLDVPNVPRSSFDFVDPAGFDRAKALPDGACIELELKLVDVHVMKGTWRAIGSTIKFDRTMWFIWKDGFIRHKPIPSQPGRPMWLVENGDKLMLNNNTLLLEKAGDDSYRMLVNVIVFESGFELF